MWNETDKLYFYFCILPTVIRALGLYVLVMIIFAVSCYEDTFGRSIKGIPCHLGPEFDAFCTEWMSLLTGIIGVKMGMR